MLFFLSWTMQPVLPMASVFSAPRSIGRVYCRLGFVIIQNEDRQVVVSSRRKLQAS